MNALAALEPFIQRWRAVAQAGERCETCAEPIDEDHHPHLVDVERRLILCVCAACGLGRAGPADRYRPVPTRVLADPNSTLDDASWAALQIPVGLAFIFFNSRTASWVVIYPSPAGATESDLPRGAFASLVSAAPLIEEAQPDVEALLVYRRVGRPFEALLAPIDVCYELVGKVRVHWSGFHGGDRAWSEIEAFFGELRARAGVKE